MSEDSNNLSTPRKSIFTINLRKRKKIEDDSTEDDSTEDESEKDTSLLKNSILENILHNLTYKQQCLLKSSIQKGINSSFELFDELLDDNYGSLLEDKPNTNLWKLGLSPMEIEQYDVILKELRASNDKKEKITVKKIVECELHHEQKRKLVQLFDILQTIAPNTEEYLDLENRINLFIVENKSVSIVDNITDVETKMKDFLGINLPLKQRIINSELDDKRKSVIYEKYLLLQAILLWPLL